VSHLLNSAFGECVAVHISSLNSVLKHTALGRRRGGGVVFDQLLKK